MNSQDPCRLRAAPAVRATLLGISLAAAALLGTSGCAGCGERPDGSHSSDPASGSASARKLDPLPAPPPLSIDPLSGAARALTVVAARPQGSVVGAVRPTVTFSRPVKALDDAAGVRAADAAAPFARIEPRLEGEWRWLGSTSVEFVPRGHVPYSTEFRVTVAKGLKALDGSELTEDFGFSFLTPALVTQEVSPWHTFKWLPPDARFEVLFNQPVADTELATHARFVVAGEAAPFKVRVEKRVSIREEQLRKLDEAKRAGRPDEPLPDNEFGLRNQQTRYTLAPERPLPPGRRVALEFGAGLHGEQGPLPASAGEQASWETYGPLELRGVRFCAKDCPYGPLVIETTNELVLASLKERLRVEPAVELDWDAASVEVPSNAYQLQWPPTVNIPGKFKPGTSYTVSVAAGVEDVFKQRSAAPLRATARTRDLEPALVTGPFLGVVEAAEGVPPRLPVEVSNLSSLDVKLWRLSTEELARLVSYEPWSKGEPIARAPDLSTSEPLRYARNQGRVHPIQLAPVLPVGAKAGSVLVHLSSKELSGEAARGAYQLVQVTDLAVHVKFGPASSLAWVTRLSNGAPVPGAEVSIHDGEGRSLWKGTTSAEGFVDAPGAAALPLPPRRNDWEVPRAVFVARLSDDVSATSTTWSAGLEPYHFGLSAGFESAAPESVGFFFTDRGIYRPGDTARVKGVLRYRSVGELRAPAAGSSVRVEIVDPRGKKVHERTLAVGAYGTVAFDFQSDPDGAVGAYTVSGTAQTPGGALKVQPHAFRVQPFRPLEFRVDAETPKAELVAGEALEASVRARYLYGAAMPDAPMRWSVQRESVAFMPESAPGFIFGQETWWWDDGAPHEASSFFASGQGRLDGSGAASVRAGVVDAPGAKTYEYTFEAEITDVNRQAVAARRAVRVHPAALYVGLKAAGAFFKVNEEAALDTLVVDVGGKRVAGRPFEVRVASRTWKSVKKKGAGGAFETMSEPVETEVHRCDLTSAEAGVPCRFKPTAAGLYLVRAAVKDDQGRRHEASTAVYAVGADWIAWQRGDHERLELVQDKARHAVGEVATVLVKSPYPSAKALVTVEREGVIERRLVELKGALATVEIPITEAMVPNAYVGVLLVRPRVAEGGVETGDDPGRPAARVGLTMLEVDTKGRRLAVEVKTDKAEYRPRDTVRVDVSVKSARGESEDGELTLYAVDEAVLRITGYEVPDPLAHIYMPRPLSVRIGEPLSHLVRRRDYGEKSEPRGGGGGRGEGGELRTRFKTTLFFETLETKGGRAQWSFELPDNLTSFRVMAVLVTKGERFGSGQTSLRVNKPLMALPALPRFARVGDTFEAGVVLHAKRVGDKGAGSTEGAAPGPESGPVAVTVEVKGGLALVDPTRVSVAAPVTPGTPREVRFAFKAVKPGPATLRFRASRGDEADAVEASLPVELPADVEVVAVAGDTSDVRVEGLVPPKDVHVDKGGLTVTLASTALGQLGAGFEQLVEYPYGCLEQQASRLVPFIALREIAGQYQLPWSQPGARGQAADGRLVALFRALGLVPFGAAEEGDPDRVIAATVRSIVDLQRPDGLFRYWSSSDCGAAWPSVYATLALSRAREVGFAVPAEAITAAEAALVRVVGGSCGSCERVCDDDTRAFAAYVLARLGKPRASAYGGLYAARAKLSGFGRALLAHAMYVGRGDRAQAQALLQEVLNLAKESPQGMSIEEPNARTGAVQFHSDTRTTGAVLQTLAAIQPGHPFAAKLARHLVMTRQGDGQWRSTQEAAFALMGLTELMRGKERAVPDFEALVRLGAGAVAQERFQGRDLEVRAKVLPMHELLELAKGGDGRLTFEKRGAGVLYYTATLRSAPMVMPRRALDNGLFVQRWFEPMAGGGQATSFAAGDLVRVRVRVASNQSRHWLAVEVPLPAGLEVVDTSLATTARQASSADEGTRDVEAAGDGEDEANAEGSASGTSAPEDPWATRFWSPFVHQELRDDRAVVFADHLPPGVHLVSLVARATTPGVFVLKPARATLMYEPEVWGRSEGGAFEVTVPASVSRR